MHPDRTSGAGEKGRGRMLLGAALILALGAAVRLHAMGDVLTLSGVRLAGDTDPHYHVLRAERMLRGAPGAPWRDPALSWPEGAEILWPPAFDAAIGGLAWLATAHADREDLARAASILPVLLGLGSLLVAAALARRLRADGGWLAAGILALLPAHAEYTMFGRGDQHAAEILLQTALLLAFWQAVRAARGRDFAIACAAIGALVALSAWTWMGSALFLFVPAGFAAIWHVLAPRDDGAARRAPAALLTGAGGGAVLLAISVAVLGAPGTLFRSDLRGVGGLHVAAPLGAGAFGGALIVARRMHRGTASAARRALEVLLALALPAAALLGPWRALREGAVAALTAAASRGPWYRMIQEYRPVFGRGIALGLLELLRFGLAVPAALAAVIPLARRWREDPEHRAEIVLLAVWAGLFLGLTFAAARFALYASVPVAIAAALALRELAAAATRRGGGRVGAAALMCGSLLLVAPAIPEHLYDAPLGVSDGEIAALTALRDAPAAPGREGVLAPWSLGHAVQYYAGRPVLVSPFGTDVGPAAMQDWAAFWFAPSPEAAEEVLARRRIGLLLLENPGSASFDMHAFAPPGTPVAIDTPPGPGKAFRPTEVYWSLVPVRLYFGDSDPSLAGFRLLYEGGGAFSRRLDETSLKIFGVVPGAWLEVDRAAAGALVRASVLLRTNQGRQFVWMTQTRADTAGRAMLRLPYATGANGEVEAGRWSIDDGRGRTLISIAEEEVLRGATVHATLASDSKIGAR